MKSSAASRPSETAQVKPTSYLSVSLSWYCMLWLCATHAVTVRLWHACTCISVRAHLGGFSMIVKALMEGQNHTQLGLNAASPRGTGLQHEASIIIQQKVGGA